MKKTGPIRNASANPSIAPLIIASNMQFFPGMKCKNG